MTLIPMIILLIGAMLGIRFNVLVLLPATVLVSAATLSAGVVYYNGPWSTLITAVLAIAALQVGYLVGSFVNTSAATRPGSALRRKIWLARHSPTS